MGAVVTLQRHPGQGTAGREGGWLENSTVPAAASTTFGMAGGCEGVPSRSTAPVCLTGSSQAARERGTRAGTCSSVMGWAETAHRATYCGPWEGESPSPALNPNPNPNPNPSPNPNPKPNPNLSPAWEQHWTHSQVEELLPVPRATCSPVELCSSRWSQDPD